MMQQNCSLWSFHDGLQPAQLQLFININDWDTELFINTISIPVYRWTKHAAKTAATVQYYI